MNRNNFLDRITITLISGKGGNGCVSFLSEPGNPRGGPDGGNGGKGGDIYIKGSKHLNSLSTLKSKRLIKAENGLNGNKKEQNGRMGKDYTLEIPLGTEFYFRNILYEIKDTKPIFLLKGGKGGIGNARLKKSTRQAPRFALKGLEGEQVNLDLKLKSLGHLGIVGLPNSGKSTFINTITNASSKVGDYNFTTLKPILGAWKNKTVIDIPGILPGAKTGKGLGLEFLSYISKCKSFLLIIDIHYALEHLEILLKELKEYTDKILVIFFNKSDDFDVPKNFKKQIRSIYKKKYFITSMIYKKSLIKPIQYLEKLIS